MVRRLKISSMTEKTFVRREVQGVPYYSCCALERLPRLSHGFSTRHGGASAPEARSLNLSYASCDSPERVNENRRRFLSALRLHDSKLATLHQVHSDRVCIIKDFSGQWNQSEGDALATQVEGVALAVQIADCLPILIADPVTSAVAAVHAGWKGALSRILFKTIRQMQRVFGSDPTQLVAAIGPGIRVCCFEVGSDVAELFDAEYPGCGLVEPVVARPDKYLIDLGKALDNQLRDAGIKRENSHDMGACTRCNTNEFFSYRAEGPRSGRMMALIARNK